MQHRDRAGIAVIDLDAVLCCDRIDRVQFTFNAAGLADLTGIGVAVAVIIVRRQAENQQCSAAVALCKLRTAEKCREAVIRALDDKMRVLTDRNNRQFASHGLMSNSGSKATGRAEDLTVRVKKALKLR